MGVGLIALLVTGVLAAVDRLQERTAALQAGVRAPVVKSDTAQTAKIPEAPPPAPLALAPRPPAPTFAPPSSSPPAAPPASDLGQGNRPAIVPPTPSVPPEASAFQAAMPSRFVATFGEPASEAAAPPVTPPAAVERPSQPASPPAAPLTAVERGPRNAEGPIGAARLRPPTPPVRQPDTEAFPTVARGGMKVGAAAPTECLPNGLRAVLADVASRFGDVAIVSTHQLNTANHSPGSIRERLHHACNAVDIRPERERIDEIKTYLRGRPEIGGVESYRNGIVHMDLKGSEVVGVNAQGRGGRGQAAAQTASTAAPQAPAAPQVTDTTRPFGSFSRSTR